MRYAVAVAIAFFLLAVSSPCCAVGGKAGPPIRAFEGGKLYQSPGGKFYIAELHGSFKQMGRQYGNILGGEIRAFYRELYEGDILKRPNISFAELKKGADDYYGVMPQMFKEFIDGLVETNGLDTDKTRIMTATLLFLVESAGCSSLSAWGEYTGNGEAIVGRNLDLPVKSMRKYSKYLHVIVWNPEGYGHSVAHIDYLGGLFYQTAFNSEGVFLELQNGQASDKRIRENRQNSNHALLAALFSASSMKDMDMFFETVRPETGLIMNVTSPEKAAIYEWATFRMVRRDGRGLISASNDFIDPSWKRYHVPFFSKRTEGFAYTVTRRNNLLRLGQSMKGYITPQAMMKILDTTIPEGGATFPDEGLIGTIYQVVAAPAQFKMWLKAREYSSWEEIDLKNHFTSAN